MPEKLQIPPGWVDTKHTFSTGVILKPEDGSGARVIYYGEHHPDNRIIHEGQPAQPIDLPAEPKKS